MLQNMFQHIVIDLWLAVPTSIDLPVGGSIVSHHGQCPVSGRLPWRLPAVGRQGLPMARSPVPDAASLSVRRRRTVTTVARCARGGRRDSPGPRSA